MTEPLVEEEPQLEESPTEPVAVEEPPQEEPSDVDEPGEEAPTAPSQVRSPTPVLLVTETPKPTREEMAADAEAVREILSSIYQEQAFDPEPDPEAEHVDSGYTQLPTYGSGGQVRLHSGGDFATHTGEDYHPADIGQTDSEPVEAERPLTRMEILAREQRERDRRRRQRLRKERQKVKRLLEEDQRVQQEA